MSDFQTPFDYVEPRDIIPGVLRNPPYVPRLDDLTGEMQDLVKSVTGTLMDTLQQSANASFMRQGLFWQMSEKGWDNDAFDDMVEITTVWAHYLIYGDRQDRAAAVRSAAESMITMWSCVLIDKNRQYEKYMTDAQYDNYQKKLETWRKVSRQLEGYLESEKNRGRGGRGRDRDDGRDRDRDYGRDRDRDRDRGRSDDRDYARDNRNQRSRREIERDRDRDNDRNQRSQPSNGRGWNAGREPKVAKREDPPVRTGRQAEPVAAPAAAEPAQLTVDLKKLPKVLQQLKANGSAANLVHPGAYLPMFIYGEQAAIYHRTDFKDYFLSSVFPLSKLTEEMKLKYSDHATERFLMARTSAVRDASPDRDKARKALQEMQRAKRVEDLLAAHEAEAATDGAKESLSKMHAVNLTAPIVALPDDDLFGLAEVQLQNAGLQDYSLDELIVSFTLIRPPRWTISDDGDDTRVKAARRLSTAKNWVQLRTMFDSLRDYIPLWNWEEIHKRVVEHINDILNTNFNLGGAAITSFVDDLEELQQILSEESEELMAAWNGPAFTEVRQSTLNATNDELTRRLVLGLTDDVSALIDETTAELMRVTSGQETDPRKLACFYDVEDVTLLPFTSTDLAFACVEEIGYLSEEATPELLSVVRKRYRDLERPIRTMRFMTTDGMSFFVRPSMVTELFVVSKTRSPNM